MTQKLRIYCCPVCETVAEILHGRSLELACCGLPMVRVDEKATDRGKEEHVPIVERTVAGTTVRVGDTPHPMDILHYVAWIDIVVEGKCYRQFLKPGQRPVATFDVWSQDVVARAYCSVHGLWIGPVRTAVI